MSARPSLNREILRLAVPALGALIAEPAFLIVDAALVGHLGTTPLAGLGIAGAVLQTIVGLMVFLAYSTTPAVARRFGAGQPGEAVSVGVNGMWLALGLGAVLAVIGAVSSPWLVSLFGASDAVAAQANEYLVISMWGLPAMLIVFAATGLLRGMQDTMTPLWIAGLGFGANALLNWLFIYGLGWGIAGSAAGTVTAQWGMVAAYALVVRRLANRHSASLRAQRAGIRSTATSGGWLFLRTVSLRVALLATVGIATGIGTEELAGWQIVFTIFSAAAFALDALAIAAQALIGKELGAGDEQQVHRVLARTVAWGAWFGVVVGGLIAASSGVLGIVFTGDPEIAALVQPALLVLAIAQPIAGVVFVLDGVLMGANDARYLAIAGGLNLVPFLPALWIIAATGVDGTAGLVWLAVAFFGVYLLARLGTLGWRVRSGRWLAATV
ncbi:MULTISPECIES: MATE family efflux transporter [unclassified Microbacterium]|uniref:MATE family efflux transporter n=1 Tax=unclassified Microbacterium TaxID=2609290 RepID=UPI000CFBD187|nr:MULTISPECIES: MATE family efflux transporter [unclassified Microbacterium]PQZ54792.1 MATE family efflux transporter [Microbacterium sp. MYb43]PQZ77518.1 MATE family efflux transporter [Microbacterium sp. MYb40]PRB19786.1 MATE family efflux transporter [Microbacterium sp. MYb54]PRB25843.1 MATE family efflux transporter [Microbacterium sp. MYb50]PRB64337.1 MATE family efflux transporter [Microbacterium sp. MYb24]